MASARSATEPSSKPRVIVVGLGPAGPEFISARASAVIANVPLVFVRTEQHPAAEPLIAAGAVALDEHYERAASFAEAYERIVTAVLDGARRHGVVVYAVPGSPFVLERTVELLGAATEVDLEVIPAMSFLDLAWARLSIDPVRDHVRLVDAQCFAIDAAGDPGPLLIAQMWSKDVASEVKLALEAGTSRPVKVLSHLGLADESVTELAWEDLDRGGAYDHLTCVYVPEVSEPVGAELLRVNETVRILRKACPWDIEQTHQSLVRHFVEETYEVIEAIEELGEPPDPARAAHLEEELGDVLCQVLFHATIAREEGLFSLFDVCATLNEKLVHRHPHVFGDVRDVSSAEVVVARWEEIKREEKGRESLMDGIPKALPGLLLVAKLERKAKGVGLGFADTDKERAQSVRSIVAQMGEDADGIGALLLAIARYAAANGVDPEEALRRKAAALRARFVATEQRASAHGTSLSETDPQRRLRYWNEAAAEP